MAGQLSILHAFNGPDGAAPATRLIHIGNTLYGTTNRGGASNAGTVYSMSTAGVLTTLYAFTNGADGGFPSGRLFNVGTTIYGTTDSGGTSGRGVVFKLTPDGTETVLHSFAGGSDGSNPAGGMIMLGGVFYGTTFSGGTNDAGTVYAVNAAGGESVIYTFTGHADGLSPVGELIAVQGALYGATENGGANNAGTIFRVTTGGVETVMHSFVFGATDGEEPHSGPQQINSVLFGTTPAGGTGSGCRKLGCGVVYALTLDGSETIVHSFSESEGTNLNGSMISYDGLLYGTAAGGGDNAACFRGCGTVFSLTTAGALTVLHKFKSGFDGLAPEAGLAVLGTRLYGTTDAGGGGTGCSSESGCGTVFAIKP